MQLITNDTQRNVRLNDINLLKQKEVNEKEKDQKNRNFVMFYRENMPEMRWLMINHPFASAVFLFITEHMDGKNTLACSYSLMTEYFQKNRSTIHRAIKVLEENGFLTIMKMGNSNIYLVNSSIAWTSYNNQKSGVDMKYASLDGKILVSRKENIDYELKNQSERFKKLGKTLSNKHYF